MTLSRIPAISILALISIHAFIGCGGKGGGSAPTAKEIYANDMNQFKSMSNSGALQVNSASDNAFTKIFGGTSNQDVLNFIQMRVKHVLNESDLEKVDVSPATALGSKHAWLDSSIPTAATYDDVTAATTNGLNIIATNYGTVFWLMSRVAGVPITLHMDSKEIPVDSSRVGFVVLAKGYRESETFEGVTIHLPTAYRMTAIVHEARHSDCTGGFPNEYIAKAKTAASYKEFLNAIKKPQLACGHLHIPCPTGHNFAGAVACDNEQYGTYGVSAVFATAMAKGAAYNSEEQRIMAILASDMLGRLPTANLNDWAKASADMSSTR